MLRKMKSQDFQLPDSLNLTPDCKNLLKQLLHPDHESRVKMAGECCCLGQATGLKADLPSVVACFFPRWCGISMGSG
jgi:hypothetical protein